MGSRGPRPTKGEAIARAALELFVEHGVHGTTTRAIAHRAHTTEGNLYRYHASKLDLARRVLVDCLVDFGEFLARAIEGRSGPRERLRAFVVAYVDYARTHVAEHALIVEAHLRDLGGLPPDLLRPRNILIGILEDGIAQGEFVAGDPRIVAPFIAGGLARSVLVHAATGGPTPVRQAADQLADMVERMLGAASD